MSPVRGKGTQEPVDIPGVTVVIGRNEANV